MLFEIVSTCKGGGYRYARTRPVHPRANSNGLYPLHRVIVENSIGRLLDRDEVVHHVDENKDNNDLANLQVLGRSAHAREHAHVVPLISFECSCCGASVTGKPHVINKRLRSSTKPSCSRKCARAIQFL